MCVYGISSFGIITYNNFLIPISMFIYSLSCSLIHSRLCWFFNSRWLRVISAHAAFICIFFSNIFAFYLLEPQLVQKKLWTFPYYVSSRFTITLITEWKTLVFGSFLWLSKNYFNTRSIVSLWITNRQRAVLFKATTFFDLSTYIHT